MRRLVPLLLALGLVGGQPALAAAHEVLERTDPAAGTTVERLPAAVRLTFSDPPLAVGAQVLVTGPVGDVASGTPSIEGRVLSQPLLDRAPAGDYTVTYRVTAEDGHPVTGTFSFHATVGLDGSTATAGARVPVRDAGPSDGASGQESQLVPVMLTVAGALALVAVGAVVVMRGRR
ncbi:MAG TPA: copper resistance CopC family protein [Intrasporangium sp.]|uniref:copper resistance CopC family protein n=1 Tax=Intrasporangium sp. TaxID=1925024 RepID=UPI002D78244D|nr:copper resistance CopC family protein [Intrasporangium sp.]HET7399454.1 copper resistance CopC family protein [Intrasporangium sp.]